jgi:hypothetical protein
MKKTSTAFLTLTALLGCGAPPDPEDDEVAVARSALAVEYRSPFGAAPVDVVVGMVPTSAIPPLPAPVLLFRRRSDSACRTYLLSSFSQLTITPNIFLSDGPDWARIPAPGSPVTIACTSGAAPTTTFSAPVQLGANYIMINGLGGNDFLSCSGPAGNLNVCNGGPGNDFVEATTPTVGITGGPGNDQLVATSGGPGLLMYGEGGDDCLEVGPGTPPAGAYDCGAGSFDRSTGPLGTGCESQTATCHGD